MTNANDMVASFNKPRTNVFPLQGKNYSTPSRMLNKTSEFGDAWLEAWFIL